MLKCTNCAQETEITIDLACKWCGYPLISRTYSKEKVTKEAEQTAKGKTEQDTVEAKEAEQRARIKALNTTEEKVDFCQGDFKLVVQFNEDFKQLQQFGKYLKGIENLSILWTGGSEHEGAIISISVQQPMDLIHILDEIPIVEQITVTKKNIAIMLKTPKMLVKSSCDS